MSASRHPTLAEIAGAAADGSGSLPLVPVSPSSVVAEHLRLKDERRELHRREKALRHARSKNLPKPNIHP